MIKRLNVNKNNGKINLFYHVNNSGIYLTLINLAISIFNLAPSLLSQEKEYYKN